MGRRLGALPMILAAGGVVTDVDGRPWSTKSRTIVVAGNPELHNKLINVVLRSMVWHPVTDV